MWFAFVNEDETESFRLPAACARDLLSKRNEISLPYCGESYIFAVLKSNIKIMENNSPYFERETEVMHTQGNLPHWSQASKLYFVTFRLNDSMPDYVMEKFKSYCDWRERMLELHGFVPEEMTKYEIDKRNRMMEYIDAGHGECLLKNPEVREILCHCIEKMNGHNSRVHCYVIMPNHVHLILETFDNQKASGLIGRLKSISTHMINKSLGRKGSLWQYEIYDRLIRNAEHYWRSVRYIARNSSHCLADTYTLYLNEEHKMVLGM